MKQDKLSEQETAEPMRMRFPGNVVTKQDTRSEDGGRGDPTKCFYCNAAIGGEHSVDCVILDRPVKLRLTVDLIIPMPRSWSQERIEYYLNGGGYCKDNIGPHVTRQQDAVGCMCTFASFDYVGEATTDEARKMGLLSDTTLV